MFKKILSTVLLLAVIFTVFSMAFVPCSAATVTDGEKFYTLGDANDDGLTDIRDLVRIKLYTADTTTTIAEVAADLDLRPTNIKLRQRMINIVMEITGTDNAAAEKLLEDNEFNIRKAIDAFKENS